MYAGHVTLPPYDVTTNGGHVMRPAYIVSC